MTKTAYCLTLITHQSEYLVSKKSGDKFSWLAFVKFKDGLYELRVALVKLNLENPEETECKSAERMYQTQEEATKYLNYTLRHFPNFEKRILTFDEEYDDKYCEKVVTEWLQERV